MMSSPSIVITRLLSLATVTTSATTAFTTINASSSRRHIIINARNLVTAIATTTSRNPSYAAATRSFTTSSTATSAMSSFHEFDTGYLNAQDAADLDVELMSSPGFSLEQLMELAGLSVAEAVYEVAKNIKKDDDLLPMSHTTKWGDPPPSRPRQQRKRRVLLVCGPGNNGGDGLVAARHLYHFGLESTVVYPKPSTKTHFINLVQQLEDLNIPVLNEIPTTDEEKKKFDIVVDAIFGFSFKGTAPREPFATAINQMVQMQKEHNSLLLSVDVPSSWNVDGGDLSGSGFKPDVLISLTAPKLSAKKFEGRHFVGGRFVPPGLAEKYKIKMPPYPGVSQVVELPFSRVFELPKTKQIISEKSGEENVMDEEEEAFGGIEDNTGHEKQGRDAEEVDWALEYQSYLEEKEKANADDDSDRSEEKRKEDTMVDGEDWAREYAEHCAEKEKEFFEENKPKEL